MLACLLPLCINVERHVTQLHLVCIKIIKIRDVRHFLGGVAVLISLYI